eukprot:4395899-Amphidinium_carterae.1
MTRPTSCGKILPLAYTGTRAGCNQKQRDIAENGNLWGVVRDRIVSSSDDCLIVKLVRPCSRQSGSCLF